MRCTQESARFKDELWCEIWAGTRMRVTSKVSNGAVEITFPEGTELIVGDPEK